MNPLQRVIDWLRHALRLEPVSGTPRLTLALVKQVWEVTVPFWRVPGAWKNVAVLLIYCLYIFGASVIGVFTAKIAGDRFDALAHPNSSLFYNSLILFVVVSVLTDLLATALRLPYDLLDVRWRDFLTRRLMRQYFGALNYYRLTRHPIIDNPDERIAEDIKQCISVPESIFFGALRSASDLVVFGAVLWHFDWKIIPWCVAVITVNCWLSLVFSRPLFVLGYAYRRLQGDFRAALLKVRKEAESIAFLRGEAPEQAEIYHRNDLVIENAASTLIWQTVIDLLLFSLAVLVRLIPVLLAAPLVFRRRTTLGGYTQIINAWNRMGSSLGFVVGDLQDLLPGVAAVSRVHALIKYSEAGLEHRREPDEKIAIRAGEGLTVENLTVTVPEDGQCLIRDLSFSTAVHGAVMVIGRNGAGKTSLLRSLAGLWRHGSGEIRLPPPEEVLFLPQTPYMSLGSLRQQILYPLTESVASDSELRAILEAVSLGDLEERAGGFDSCRDWARILSLGEQQRLTFARALARRPLLLILDEATDALDPEGERAMYALVKAAGCAYLSASHRATLAPFHDSLLHLGPGGSWTLSGIETQGSGSPL